MFHERPDGNADQILRSHTEFINQNLKTFLRFSRCGAPLFARRLSKTEFWTYFFTPLFFKIVFLLCRDFLARRTVGPGFIFFGFVSGIFNILNVCSAFWRFSGSTAFFNVLLPFLCFAKRSNTRVVNNHPVQGTWVPPGIVKPSCNGFRRFFF